jgi:hypothetical protein
MCHFHKSQLVILHREHRLSYMIVYKKPKPNYERNASFSELLDILIAFSTLADLHARYSVAVSLTHVSFPQSYYITAT